MQEKILNRVISYWYECIRQEDILGKDISISVRSKAVLYPFNQDSFIFRKNELKIEINDEKILEFHNYARTKGFESYYGYPVLFYFDEESAKYLLAPLFIIKISFLPDGGKLYLQKDEPIPVCGIQALNKLGLKTEEIADINQLIETTFRNSVSISKENLVKKCIDIISKETYIQINEEINPGFLSNAKKLSKNSLPGLYNKSLIFIGDNTIYNMSLLEDLLELRLKNDLENTSLSFLLSNYTPTEGRDLIPILPFPANEYQIAALKDIFLNRLSVITGPPGTGKSQFISNLLINLFLEGKSVLFVSHTNPAVEVVNNKINSNFNNLMLRTGRKELREDLKGKFTELLLESQKSRNSNINYEILLKQWHNIQNLRNKLLGIDKVGNALESDINIYEINKKNFTKNNYLEDSFTKLSEFKINKLNETFYQLKRLSNKKYTFFEKFITIFNKNFIRKKEKDLLVNLYNEIPNDLMLILKDKQDLSVLDSWDEIFYERYIEYLNLLRLHEKIISQKQKIAKFPNKLELEGQILDLEENYYFSCNNFIQNIYIKKIFQDPKKIGNINSFFDSINSRNFSDRSTNNYYFTEALKILKIWSCTLKSLRRAFPLIPTIFDYVIFDEASQIDLPSAAPALYRAKNAVIVGDPNQLSHIASITIDIERSIANSFQLKDVKEIYPAKIRYCDMSLYKSAENSLTTKPVLLTNHYRSEDQIINLCNNVFYGGRLKIKTNLDYSKYPSSLPNGLNWIDCKGESIKYSTGSRVNYEEVRLIKDIFREIINKIEHTNLNIGIVTPYSKQQDMIFDAIKREFSMEILEKHNVEILTAHKFQGSEKDIMIFSLVLASRGNGNSDRWYNIYPQILNVALSRAKYLLYIVGDKTYCVSREGYLRRLVDNYNELKKQEKIEKNFIYEKFDTPYEKYLYEILENLNLAEFGYEVIPHAIFKRYELDLALIGDKKIDLECDGFQHEIIKGLPVIEDIERDEFLKKNGWIIKRFYNYEIISDINKIKNDILALLK